MNANEIQKRLRTIQLIRILRRSREERNATQAEWNQLVWKVDRLYAEVREPGSRVNVEVRP